MITIDKDKMRKSIKKHIQLRLTTEEFDSDVCELVWLEMFGNNEEWTDEDDEKAYQMFNTIYKEYMDGMLKVLTS